MEDQKALFDYWHGQVQLKNVGLIGAYQHVETHTLRHECTNYDELRNRPKVTALEEPARSQVITIIKYQCTAQVLQRRAGMLRDRASDFQTMSQELGQERSRLYQFVRRLQERLFGKDQEIKRLDARVATLEAENEILRVEAQSSQAYAELQRDFHELQKKFEKTQARREELARNNKSLGGRVAHAERYRRERDEARAIVQEQKKKIETLTEEVRYLRRQLEATGERA